jgi:hypothetical protein
MRSSAKVALSLAVFAAVALLYPVGCVPPCEEPEFEYSREDMRSNLMPLSGEAAQFSGSNDSGVVTLTLNIHESSVAMKGLEDTDSRGFGGIGIATATAHCGGESSQQITIDATASATFAKDSGGDEQVLFSDRSVDLSYVVVGHDGIDNGRISVVGEDDLSFELDSETGEPEAFELTSFWSQQHESATYGYR